MHPFIIFFVPLMFLSSSCGDFCNKITNATFGRTYNCNVSIKTDNRFIYQYPNYTLGKAVRVYTFSSNASISYPVLFVIKQQQSVLSWTVPTLIEAPDRLSYSFYNVSRTLCPDWSYSANVVDIIIDVSTMSPYPTNFQLLVKFEDIVINDNITNITVSPTNSRFYWYSFPPDTSSVIVKAESYDNICAVLSVQEAQCPVCDVVGTVEHAGYRQTVAGRGAITVKRNTFSSASFFIVIVVKPNDLQCERLQKIISPIVGFGSDFTNRIKKLNITIDATISGSQFYGVIFGSLGLFLFFYIVALIVTLIYHYRNKEDRNRQLESNSEISNLLCDNSGSRGYGSMASASSDTNAADNSDSLEQSSVSHYDRELQCTAGNSEPGYRRPVTDPEDSSQLSKPLSNEENVDFLPDLQNDKDLVRTKTCICVADLSKKPSKKLSKKYNLYIWNLITLAIFYVLPVIQLVITYQQVVNKTGDEDICYYNFYCAYQVGFLSSFNNVYSNIGYIMLGILFIMLVYRRQYLHKKKLLRGNRQAEKCGIPQHFGLFYAMGIALSMEGILSGCYHVCPSFNNFQFDTAFMYMIGWLCMLKIYQTRHPDVNAHAHTAYCGIAFVVFFGVIGVTQGSTPFWIVFVLIYILCSLFLSINIYYMGRWHLDIGVFDRIYYKIRHDHICCSKPAYPDRLVLLVIGNVVNWSFAGFGVSTMPKDFASYLLAIVIINLLMYFAFYIIMKLRCHEKILPQPLFYIIMAAIVWGAAFYFFMKRLTSWQVTPAMSRESNEDCVLFKFYDSHDIWHFLSAISLFLSFMVLLTLEDDLLKVPRDKISVF